MADTRFEQGLRAQLADLIESVTPPNPYWSDSPAAARVTLLRARPNRRPASRLALGLAMAAGLLLIAFAGIASLDRSTVATANPTTLVTPEPWPTGDPSSLPPTTGEVPLGGVAVITEDGKPTLLVRLEPVDTAPDAYLLMFRTITPPSAEMAIERFRVRREGLLGDSPVRNPLDAGNAGDEHGLGFVLSDPAGTLDLVFTDSAGQPIFWWPIHRDPAPIRTPTATIAPRPTATSVPAPTTDAWPADPGLVAAGGGAIRLGAIVGWPEDEWRVFVRVSADPAGGFRVEARAAGGVTETFGPGRLALLREGVVVGDLGVTGSPSNSIMPGDPVGTERSFHVDPLDTGGANADIGITAGGTVYAAYPIARVAPRTMEQATWGGGTQPAPSEPDPSLPAGARELARAGRFLSVAWSPDGTAVAVSTVATDGADGSVLIFFADGRNPLTFNGAMEPSWVDGSRLAMVERAVEGVRIIATDGREVATVPGQWTGLLGDGRGTLYLGKGDPASPEGPDTLYSWRDGSLTPRGGLGRPIAVSPDGATLAILGASFGTDTVSTYELLLRRTADFSAIAVPTAGPLTGVWCAHFSPDGAWLAASRLDGVAMLQVGRGDWIPVAVRAHAAFFEGWTPEGAAVVSARNGIAREIAYTWRGAGPAIAAATEGTPSYAPAGDGVVVVAAGTLATPVAVVSRSGREVRIPLTTWQPGGQPLAWSPDGSTLVMATGSWDDRYQDRLVMVVP